MTMELKEGLNRLILDTSEERIRISIDENRENRSQLLRKARPAGSHPRDLTDLMVVSADDIAARWENYSLGSLQLILTDEDYYVPTAEQWSEILTYNRAEERDYMEHRRDCDDYAIYVKGCVGMNWGVNGIGLVMDVSSKHAYNVLLLQMRNGADYTFAAFEPQTDRYVAAGSEGYRAWSGFVIL